MNQKLGTITIVALIVIIVLVVWTMRDYQNDFLQKVLFGKSDSSASNEANSKLTPDKIVLGSDNSSSSGVAEPADSTATEAPKLPADKTPGQSKTPTRETTTTIVRDNNRITGEPLPSNWPSFVPPMGGSNITSVYAKEGQSYLMSADIYKNPQAVLRWYQIKLSQAGFTFTSSTSASLHAKNDQYEVTVDFEHGSTNELSCTYAITVYPAVPIDLPPGFVK